MNRSDEIKGGLKNAISRGENLQKAKQSFINAGYTREEVEQAEKFLNVTQENSEIQERKIIEKPKQNEKQLTQQKSKPLPTSSIQNNQNIATEKKQFPRWLVIALIVFSALAIIFAAILGIYWNKLF